MTIDKLVYGKNVRDSVQANYIKTNEIIDKVNEGGSDTGLHGYTIYEGDTSGLSFTTTAPITNFKFVELYYTYTAKSHNANGSSSTLTSSSKFTKIINPITKKLYIQSEVFAITTSNLELKYYVSPNVITYYIYFVDANNVSFKFYNSCTPQFGTSEAAGGVINTDATKIYRETSDDLFSVTLQNVIGYV